jgi:hypothetical protein
VTPTLSALDVRPNGGRQLASLGLALPLGGRVTENGHWQPPGQLSFGIDSGIERQTMSRVYKLPPPEVKFVDQIALFASSLLCFLALANCCYLLFLSILAQP